MSSAMANNTNSEVSQQHFQQQDQQQPNSSPYHCKECGLYLNSAKSLDVHLQYHKENLLKNWAIQAASSHSEETNNNTTAKVNIKHEFVPNNCIDNNAFSPNFQNYQQIKSEPTSPVSHYQNNYSNYSDQQQFFQLDSNQQQPYVQGYSMHKAPSIQTQNASYRYHPYVSNNPQPQHSPYDRTQSQAQVPSSSPVYSPQPTPSPSPKQCDKCGYVCESAAQLLDHLSLVHPPTPAPHYQTNQHFMYSPDQPPPQQQQQIKTEEDAQSEILDLDSHKVHQVYQEEEKQRPIEQNGGHNPHSVSAMLNSWSPNQQQKLFHQEQRMYNMSKPPDMFPQQAMPEFMGNVTTPTTQDGAPPPQTYRPFEHLPQPNTPVISNTQVPNNQPPQNPPVVSPATKSTNWKSNEARRPKTYNCTACNKWFTSSGHLKRHYNTTLHKNAVKSSGQPDPASLPISAHHHPARESASSKEESSSGSPESRGEDTNSLPPQFERLAMPYDHSNLTNLSNGSPPNGEAGPSTNNLDSRGLLSLNTPPQHHHLHHNTVNTTTNTPHGFSMAAPPPPPAPPHPMVPMENTQFQMYPNGSAPHVTQAMVINNHNTTGEYQQFNNSLLMTATLSSPEEEQQPLPSFAQIQAHRYFVVGYNGGEEANVGGGGSVTTPTYTSYYTNDATFEVPETRNSSTYIYPSQEDYKLTVLTAAAETPIHVEEPEIIEFSPNYPHMHLDPMAGDSSKLEDENQPASPEKARTKRDYEEAGMKQNKKVCKTIAKPGQHKCFDCDKVFNKACYLTQHNKTFHCGDKPFKCTRCGKRFSCETIYKEHIEKHAGDKPHKCDLCPKQFNHKTDLRRHLCLHTGKKPYACDTCGKGFIRKDHMLKHVETHNKKAAARGGSLR